MNRLLQICLLSFWLLLLFRPLVVESRPKVGLVLGGGGARGTAHIGILKVLEQEGIPIDLIVGNSFGAVVGGLYATGYSGREIERIVNQTDWNQLFDDLPSRKYVPSETKGRYSRYVLDLGLENFQPVFPRGITSGQKITQLLRRLTQRATLAVQGNFDNLRIPFRALATDLTNGQPFVFKEGDLADALRASISFPLLFVPFKYQGHLLVDGALTDNVPTDLARQMGADFVIAVNASAPLRKAEEIRNFFDVFDQSLTILINRNIKASSADFLFTPDLGPIRTTDFYAVKKGIQAGEESARAQLETLKAKLESKGIRTAETLPETTRSVAPNRDPVISAIGIEGNERVSPDQILGAVTSKAGETLQTAKVTADVERILGLGLFQSVDFRLVPQSPETVELRFVVEEASQSRLGVGLRYDLDYQFTGKVDLRFRNVLGRGSELFLENRIGNLKEYRLGWRSPRLIRLPIYIRPSLFYKQRDRLLFSTGELLAKYLDTRVGGELVMAVPVRRSSEASFRYGLEQSDIFGGIGIFSQVKPQLVGSLNLSFLNDTLDDVDFPTRGGQARLNLSWSRRQFGSDFNFSKYSLEMGRHYSFTSADTVSATIFLGGSHGTIPFFERFYAGGVSYAAGSSSQLYGFRRDEFLSRNLGILDLAYRRRLQKGSFSFMRALYLGFHYNIAGLEVAPESTRTQLLHGVGLGFYVDTLVGPIRFDAGLAENGRANLYISVGPRF